MTPAKLLAWKHHEIIEDYRTNRRFELFFLFGAYENMFLCDSWLTRSQWCSSPGHSQQLTRRHLTGDGTSRIGVAGARQWAGLPSSEPGQGGGLGMVERTWTLEALQCGGLPPYWERTEGGCPRYCCSGAGGCPALSLHHRPAVHAPVSTRHR